MSKLFSAIDNLVFQVQQKLRMYDNLPTSSYEMEMTGFYPSHIRALSHAR